MIQTPKDKPTGKTVLLFSGGMDSVIIAHLMKPDVLLYVAHGNRYEKRELETAKILAEGAYGKPLQVQRLDFLGGFERPDALIPLRNLFFFAVGALYGEKVILGAVAAERILDKSKPFFTKMSDVLSYLYQDQHWCEGRTIDACAPYKDYTKTQLVKLYLEAGGSVPNVLESYSCYEHFDAGKTGRACGWCKACFRKWVALENNGIRTAEYKYFANTPHEAPWLPEWRALLAEQGSVRPGEDEEWLAALAKVGHA